MGKSANVTDKTRDEILTQSVIYRKMPKEIAESLGCSYDTARRTIQAYELVKAKDWEKLTAKAFSRDISEEYVAWDELASQSKVPQDVMDIAFSKKQVPVLPADTKTATNTETAEKILAVLQAIEADLPQILTALTYLSKTVKETVNANADPMMQMLKTANETLVGIKCNTRKLGDR